MPILQSRIDRNGDNFRSNRDEMLALIAAFRDIEQKVREADRKSVV